METHVWIATKRYSPFQQCEERILGLVALPSLKPLETVDLAASSSSTLWRFAALTNDGLLAFRQVGGQAGSQLVPDLARALPDVLDQGKTYRLQLLPNVRYSNGHLVRASDFRYAIERVFKLQPHPNPGIADTFRGIRGADRCNQRHCDLSAGIVTDDAARTITFHLSAPDPGFRYKLVTAAAVPADSRPDNERSDRRVRTAFP
jgi:peptide/nickel transport system substrate-binding protein